MRLPRLSLWLFLFCAPLYANDTSEPTRAELSDEEMDQCLRIAVTVAGRDMSINGLRDVCNTLAREDSSQRDAISQALAAMSNDTADQENDPSGNSRLLERRLNMEALNRANRFLLTPHKRNYLLPVSYQEERNTAPYAEAGTSLASQQSTEVEFQLSVKILIREGIFGDNGHLYMAYTNHSLWQAYYREISRPFRETNHQPELILSFVNDWNIFGFRNVLNEVMITHQSNGQSGDLSRSWDRIMVNSVFERGPFAFSFNPWYRIPESEGDGPDDPTGDDNPDIHKYMGNFELSAAWHRKDNIVSLMLRNNLRSNNRGAVELGYSFPVSSTVRGYLKVFSGYGHSLIDYDHHTNAVGLGITFTDLF
ncbi:phospholipase A1 [Marinimicrobium koreense]|uniref:Phospholipase A1 n=1 Tax=Marinimicrobium koreense TaxID=306545 RepID=A0A3N1NLY6_9GAMM|nr:phospholipase A [Marinimicrobium koreense]ROQ20814.1 phospholipase A1 [Marinimicrobium koreense]